ncbi:hypothetical protein HD599_000096 [Conyzicola lurida]|uniref:Uncharacterized protein n=1 Tax=Conyzicola lurida TaxID=1172621 RepID=A0A841AJA8_9MICO|nr:hypothetical protein [Conyzicola lurida]MBB5841773.1 hypothetical protein [Conyzicola lurida]
MSTESSTTSTPKGISGSFSNNLELVIAILLGVVSIFVAYASFQAALYGGAGATAYAVGGTLSTEAESLYLEGNQQYQQDNALWNDLTLLSIDINGADEAAAAIAQEKYDTLVFQGVSEDFQGAIDRATEQNEADEEFYYSPLDDEEYQDSLFSGYSDTKDKADAKVKEGDDLGAQGDKLTLYTVLMSISLFLLGVAALVSQTRTQFVLIGTSVVIFGVSAVLALLIPFMGIS